MTRYSIIYYSINSRGERINVGALAWNDTDRVFLDGGINERTSAFIKGYIDESVLTEDLRQLRLSYFELPRGDGADEEFVKKFDDPFNGFGMTAPRGSTVPVNDLALWIRDYFLK